MARTLSYRKIALGLLVFSLGKATAALAAPWSLSGEWGYQDSRDSVQQINQEYTVDAAYTGELTDAMTISGSVRYYRSIDDDNSIHDTITPSFSYRLKNELFGLDLNASAVKRQNDGQSDTSNRNWGVNLTSGWKPSNLRPRLRLFVMGNMMDDNESPRNQDTSGLNGGASIDWSTDYLKFMEPVQMFYSYNWQDTENKVAESTSKSWNHLARMNFGKRFWQDRGNLSVALRYTNDQQEYKLPVDETGTAYLQLSLAQVRAGEAEVDDDDDDLLSSLPELIDGSDMETAITTDPDDDLPLHIVIEADHEPVDRIYLYTTESLLTDAEEFVWDIYTSSDGTNWTQTQSLSTTDSETTLYYYEYDGENRRYVLYLSTTTAQFVRLVASSEPLSQEIEFSEIEAFQAIAATGDFTVVETEQSNYSTNVNLFLQLHQDLNLISSLAYERKDSTSSSDLEKKNVSGRLVWQPKTYLSANWYVNYNSTDRDDSPEEQDQSTGLGFTYTPIETVDTSFGFTMSERFEGAEKISSSYNYDMQITADLYKDLGSRTDFSYSISEDYESDTTTEGFDTGLTLTARLIPKVLGDLRLGYSKYVGSSAEYSMDTGLTWRPTAKISYGATFTQSWDESTEASATFRVDWAMTDTMQINFSDSVTFDSVLSSSYSLSWRWGINDYLSLQTSSSYQTDESGDSWSFTSRLNARYSPE